MPAVGVPANFFGVTWLPRLASCGWQWLGGGEKGGKDLLIQE